MVRNVADILFGWIGTPGAILLNVANFLEFGSVLALVLSLIVSVLVIIFWIVKIRCTTLDRQLKQSELNNYNNHDKKE